MTLKAKPTRTASAALKACAFVLPSSEPTRGAPMEFSTISVLPPLVAGGFYARDGRGPFTYDVAEVVARTKANGADIPVYLDHADSGIAYGWIDHSADPVQGADGGWEWPVEYTTEGLALLQSRAYRYTSMGFHYVPGPGNATTPNGRITSFYENSLVTRPAFRVRALASDQTTSSGYTDHQPSTDLTPMNLAQLALLGLTADATSEQITEALTALRTASSRAAAIIEASGAPADADAPAVAQAAAQTLVASGAFVAKSSFDEAVARATAYESELNTLKAAQAEAAAQAAETAAVAAVDAAISGGKFTPAVRDALLVQARQNIDAFNAIVDGVEARATTQSALATRNAQDGKTTLPDETVALMTALNLDLSLAKA